MQQPFPQHVVDSVQAKMQWVNVEAFLDKLSSQLGEGQLLHGQHFNLADAMSAVEIGDHKMDQGSRMFGSPDSGLTLTQLQDKYAPSNMTFEQMVPVCDAVLAAEATWHNGANMLQSLGTCLYLWNVDRLQGVELKLVHMYSCHPLQPAASGMQDIGPAGITSCLSLLAIGGSRLKETAPAAYAYTVATLTTAALVSQIHLNCNTSEDEDCLVLTFGMSLPSDSSSEANGQVLSMLDGEIHTLEDLVNTKGDAADAATSAAAMLARLQFRRTLLQVLDLLFRMRGSECLEAAKKLLQSAQEQLSRASSSRSAGLPDDQDSIGTEWGVYAEIAAVLAVPVPPRPLRRYTLAAAYNYFERLLHELLHVCELPSITTWYALKQHLIAAARRALTAGASHGSTAGPSAISRALMHNAICLRHKPLASAALPNGSDGRTAGTHQRGAAGSGQTDGQSPKERNTIKPAETAADVTSSASAANNAQPGSATGLEGSIVQAPFPWAPSQDMVCRMMHLPPLAQLRIPELQEFVSQAVIGMDNWVQMHCLNTARRQRRLKYLLEDWANLHTHAIGSDALPEAQAEYKRRGWKWEPTEEPQDEPSGPLSCWTEAETAEIMLERLLTGFELQLYSPHEFAVVYWYCDYLVAVMSTCLSKVDRCKPTAATTQQQAGRSGSKSKGKGRSAAREQGREEPKVDAAKAELFALEGMRAMAAGMMRASLGLAACGHARVLTSPYNTDEERFEQRFGRFSVVSRPEPLTYQQWASASDIKGVQPAQLYFHAAECLSNARRCMQALTASELLTPWLLPSQRDWYGTLERALAQNLMALQLLLRDWMTASGMADASAHAHHHHHHHHHEHGGGCSCSGQGGSSMSAEQQVKSNSGTRTAVKGKAKGKGKAAKSATVAADGYGQTPVAGAAGSAAGSDKDAHATGSLDSSQNGTVDRQTTASADTEHGHVGQAGLVKPLQLAAGFHPSTNVHLPTIRVSSVKPRR